MDELTVLVTGSSRGIGRAAAIRLAREGYTVVVHGRTMSDALKATLSEVQALSPASRALTFDVSDREAARAAVSADVEAHGAYYGLVLNAGINADGTFAAMPAEDWDRVIAVDLGSFYNVVQPLVMPMVHRRKPGRIVVMSSMAGVIGNRGQVNYSAAKAGLIGAVKALALEHSQQAGVLLHLQQRYCRNCAEPGVRRFQQTDQGDRLPDHQRRSDDGVPRTRSLYRQGRRFENSGFRKAD